jgi:hypothetical protein
MYASHADALRRTAHPRCRAAERLYHEVALRTFLVIVLRTWGHLFQAFQIYVLGWPGRGRSACSVSSIRGW